MKLIEEQIETQVELLFNQFRIAYGYRKSSNIVPVWKNKEIIDELKSIIKLTLISEIININDGTDDVI